MRYSKIQTVRKVRYRFYFEGFLKMIILVELNVVKNYARAQVEVDESWIDAMERKESKEWEVWDAF